jgi:hypothetical protein
MNCRKVGYLREGKRGMAIDEAINQLSRGTTESRNTNNKLLREALKLGIEALTMQKKSKWK